MNEATALILAPIALTWIFFGCQLLESRIRYEIKR